MDVSLIIPVFNVGAFLREGLDSVVSQNFAGSYEIIIVDDCSHDNSREVCKNFKDRYPELITYIELDENLGVSAARNVGLKTASGRYIMFVDPDDLMSENAVQALFDIAVEQQADIVKGNNQIFSEKKFAPAPYNAKQQRVYYDDDILVVLLEHEIVRGHPWGKLFLKEVFLDIEFPRGVKMAQDFVYCVKVFNQAKKLVIFDETVYFYRLRSSGSTGGKYNSGAYKFWFDSIEWAAQLAVKTRQKRALKKLKMRTLHQSIREARVLKDDLSREVFNEIISRANAWDITIKGLYFSKAYDVKTIVRYLQFKYICHYFNKKLKTVS